MMNNEQKVNQLRNHIVSALQPLISKECILLDAPYYHNIGDVLIWEGEKAFLNSIGSKCLYTASYETCTFPKIKKETTVIFNGGGNLGDIYHEHFEFLKKVIDFYPNNRIIICPQTVYYNDKVLEERDMLFLRKHTDLYFCARDNNVYVLLKRYFGSKAILVPDMAFCITPDILKSYCLPETKNILTIDRKDCEKLNCVPLKGLCNDVSDWPVFEKSFYKSTFINKIFKYISDLHIPLLSSFSNNLWNVFAQKYFCHLMIKEGVRFISPYNKIISSRLHGCILSILLNKEVILIDNSYGKNRHFYETWLNDLNSITINNYDEILINSASV